MDFKDADLAQIKKVIAGEKVGEFIISHDTNEILKENDDYKIKLLVKTVYYDGDSGELYADKNTYYTDAELEDGVDQTSHTSGEDLDDMIFSNDYDTAKEFEEDYPGLFKVV